MASGQARDTGPTGGRRPQPGDRRGLDRRLAAAVNTAALVGNEQLVLIERRQTGEGNEQ